VFDFEDRESGLFGLSSDPGCRVFAVWSFSGEDTAGSFEFIELIEEGCAG
jgi:hypothetical protein